MNNFNCAFSYAGLEFCPRIGSWLRKASTMIWKIGVITTARKAIQYGNTMFAAVITDLKTPYIVYLKYIFLCQAKTAKCDKF